MEPFPQRLTLSAIALLTIPEMNAAMVVFDDFSGTYLDNTRWNDATKSGLDAIIMSGGTVGLKPWAWDGYASIKTATSFSLPQAGEVGKSLRIETRFADVSPTWRTTSFALENLDCEALVELSYVGDTDWTYPNWGVRVNGGNKVATTGALPVLGAWQSVAFVLRNDCGIYKMDLETSADNVIWKPIFSTSVAEPAWTRLVDLKVTVAGASTGSDRTFTVDYVQYSEIPEPVGISLWLLGSFVLLRRRHGG